MSATFTNAKVDSVLSTRTLVYTAPGNTQSVIHGLFISNIDAGLADHAITLEVKDVSLAYHTVCNVITVPYASTLIFDKPVNLQAGEALYATADISAKLAIYASVLEKI